MVKRSKFKFMEHVFKIQRIHESTNRLELIDCGFFFGSVKIPRMLIMTGEIQLHNFFIMRVQKNTS